MADKTKLADFLTSKKIDPRRVMAASHKLETLQREDRVIRLNRRRARGAEGDKAVKEERKPRTGRPVTPRAMDAALKGGTLSGPVKQRILRAVNHILEQRKADKVELKSLF